MAYDQEADMRLKEIGNKLVQQLQECILQRNPMDTWGAFAGATAMAQKAVGFLPIGDGPNKVSDNEIVNAIPRVEGILAIIAACKG